MSSTATAAQIREAYRREARRHHPDQAVTGATAVDAQMSSINEAYRVLRDAGRRAVYDAQLRTNQSSAARLAARPCPQPDMPRHSVSSPRRDGFADDRPGPARYPWKLVLVMAGLGIAVVLAGAALYQPSEPSPPDNVLQPGSCVEIEYTGDAREVNCAGSNDLVVRSLVAFDALCPVGTSAHRDRQGLGNACVERAAAS